MSVIQSRASRFATWLAGTILVAAAALPEDVAGGNDFFRSGAAGVGPEGRVPARHCVARRGPQCQGVGPLAHRLRGRPVGMAKVSLEGRLEAVNSAWRTLLGQPERALLGRRLSAFVYPDDLAALGGPGNPGGPAKGVAKAEVRLVSADGHLRWCELASSMVRDANSRAEYVLVSAVDITRHKQSQAALRDLATRDPLSGLANRRWFELQLAQHLRVLR